MSDIAAPSFIREDLVAEREAPVKTTGVIGFIRTRLFNSPAYVLLTIVSAMLIWFTVIPAFRFLFIDAVWHGSDREACLAQNAGHAVGACWPYIGAKMNQFIYGFYPEAERWRVNLVFLFSAVLLLPLLIPRLPAKALNAGVFFLALPVVAFFLLYGGGLSGFGVSWTAGVLLAFANSLMSAGNALVRTGVSATAIEIMLWPVAELIALLNWLREQIQTSRQPVWIDFALTTVIVSALVFFLGGRVRAVRATIQTLAVFAGIGIVIAVMGLDHGG